MALYHQKEMLVTQNIFLDSPSFSLPHFSSQLFLYFSHRTSLNRFVVPASTKPGLILRKHNIFIKPPSNQNCHTHLQDNQIRIPNSSHPYKHLQDSQICIPTSSQSYKHHSFSQSQLASSITTTIYPYYTIYAITVSVSQDEQVP